ncbi:hypothetical protein RJ640_001371 [Escallonia rubra]|uniref:Retrotransposon gag domain-containing protein n=1 Tax=Escallonia rubra TaxID=112253 RepID=A0AA88UG84_9ASTE|nr:hypothetical protein RJ640_001371 [Escallonia rubra]
MVQRTMTTEEEHALTWARFQEIFLAKYFPRNVKDDMVEEFLKLEQGEDETVKDYEARFARLSRFATHVIDTEERRATRFRNGLRYNIQKFLTVVTLDTYGQVLDKAQRVEKDVETGPIKELVQNTQNPVEPYKTCGKNHRGGRGMQNQLPGNNRAGTTRSQAYALIEKDANASP